MNNSPTLKDVAREAGLSIAAVSKALNGYPHVSEATRKRVMEVSERLGYRPRNRGTGNHGGAGSKWRIGLIMLEVPKASPYTHHWTAVMTQVAKQNGARLELGDIADQHSDRCEVDLRRYANSVDGLLLYGYVKAPVAQIIRQLRVPVLVLGDVEPGQPQPPCQVCVDAQGMGAMATRTLLAAGHRRIGFFCPEHPAGGWLDQWLAGYQLALLRSDAGLDPRLWRVFPGMGQYETGVAAAEHMASLDDPPTAYVLAELNGGMSFRHAMASRGIELSPRQIVLGGPPESRAERGFEGFPLISPTKDQAPMYAMDLLCRLSRGQSISTPHRVVMPYQTQDFEIFSEAGDTRAQSDLEACSPERV